MSYDLEKFFDLSLDLLCIAGTDGYFKKVNSSFREILGWSEDDLLDRPFLDFVHPEDVDDTVEEMERLARGEPTIAFRNRYRTDDGSYRILDWRSQPDPHGEYIYAAARDVTAEVEESGRLRQLAMAVEQGRSAVVLTDAEGRVTYANRRLHRIIGTDGAEIAGRAVSSLFERLSVPAELKEDLSNPEIAVTWREEVCFERRDGEELWVQVSVSPVQEGSDGVAGHLIVIDDVTERRRVNEALIRSARAKDDFLASMSHELRTPLNAVITITESLEEGVYGPLSDEQVEALAIVEESGRHLLDLIGDILDITKIDAGKLELERRPVDVREVCEASIRLVRDQAARKRQEVRLRVDDGLRSVEADSRRLKQILVNLLGNAVKFTPEAGEIELEAEVDADGGHALFRISDTGIGITPEEMGRLFQPFTQARSHGEVAGDTGTGLGLALSLRLAELHGGSVAVESEGPGTGSTFTVTLPWSPPGDEAASPESVPERRSVTIRRAFLVEDSAVASDHMVRYLDELGVEAVVNASGDDVVEHVVRAEPDVILLDILLPGASGWEILEELRSDPRTREIPVIVASVVDQPERGRSGGAVAFLTKPVSRSDLAGALHVAERERSKARRPDPGPGPGKGRSEGPVVLLAEDNETNVRAIRPFLESRGWTVAVVSDGNEAVRTAPRLRPDLVLMDVQMPGMDGLEATRRIRAQEADDRRVPIVALTALAMPGDRERCLAAGADEYLSKPLSLDELSRILDRYAGENGATEDDDGLG